jgi:phosphoglycerate dehydrogenase-like enzyme
MKKEFRIALTWRASEEDLKEYQGYVSPHCILLNPKSAFIEDLVEVAKEADAIIGAYIPQEMIEEAPKVKMVQILHAGVATAHPGDTVLGFRLDYLAKRNILMGNIHGNNLAVAEQAMCFLLALAKQLIPVNNAVSNNEWYPVTEETKSHMLCDSTLGIVGIGHIGGEVAKRAKAFNMRIIGVDRNPGSDWIRGLGLDFVGTPAELPRILKESDFVMLTVPLTRETFALIGEKELKMMKKSAYLINVARAHLVNEQAIHRALTEKWIKGFASDVWWFYSYSVARGARNESESWFDFGFHYSLPSRLGVNRLPNAIGSSDRATYIHGVTHSFIENGLRNVDALARGERPANIVNLDIGF